MIDLEHFFKTKQLIPDWFKNHEIFKEFKTVNKIFPSLGLNNFKIESPILDKPEDAVIRRVIQALANQCYYAKQYFQNYLHNNGNKYKPFIFLLDNFDNQLTKSTSFIKSFKVKNGLYLVADILDADGKVFCKKGESLFKSYSKLIEFGKKHYNYVMCVLDQIPEVKEYNSINISGKSWIVFSSDEMDGAWDILTMSQRGIQSCQSWSGQYRNCLIGSLIDPYTAIIYSTSGSKTEHGSKMIRRCVVRFVVNSNTKRPAIFLEYMYPGYHAQTMNVFKNAIKEHLKTNIPIVELTDITAPSYYVPCSDATQSLLKHSVSSNINRKGHHNIGVVFPYRDTFMPFKVKTTVSNDNQRVKDQLISNINYTLLYKSNISDNYINIIKNIIGSEILDKIDVSKFNNTNDFIKSVCFSYFANKKTISKNIKEKIAAEMSKHKDKSIFIPGTN